MTTNYDLELMMAVSQLGLTQKVKKRNLEEKPAVNILYGFSDLFMAFEMSSQIDFYTREGKKGF